MSKQAAAADPQGNHHWDWKFAKENFGLRGYCKQDQLPGGFWIQCLSCLVIKKLAPNGKIWLYHVDGSWIKVRPDCRVIAADRGRLT